MQIPRGGMAARAVILVLIAGITSLPSSMATDCSIDQPRTINSDSSITCSHVAVNANIMVADGATLTITDSSLEMGSDATITVRNEGALVLVNTPLDDAALVVEPQGRVDRFQRVEISVTDASEPAEGSVWAWNNDGTLRVPSAVDQSLVDGQASLLLPGETRTGGQIQEHFPWRIVAIQGAAAVSKTIEEASSTPGDAAIDLALPDDADTDDPIWSADADFGTSDDKDHHGSPKIRLVWDAAVDAVPGQPHRAIDHYEVRHAPPGTQSSTLVVGATAQPGIEVDDLVQGTHVFQVRPVDLVGNQGQFSEEAAIVIDVENPDVTLRTAPALPTGQDGWYDSVPSVTVEAKDRGPSGIHATQYKVDGKWHDYTAPIQFNTSGDHHLEVRATDRAGNIASTAIRVQVDLEPTVLDLSTLSPPSASGWHTGPVQVRVDALDHASGVDTLAYRIGNGLWTPFDGDLSLSQAGAHEIRARATDVAGNPSPEASILVRIDPDPPLVPAPDWHALDDGRVRMDWSRGAPTDIVSGLGKVFVERVGSTGEVAQRVEVPSSQSAHSLGPFPGGLQRFRITAEDMAGNSASSPAVDVAITSSPVGLHVAADGRVVRGIVPITFTPDDGFVPTEVRLYVDNVLMFSQSEGTTFNWDTTQHGDGLHVARVVATDAEGQEQVAQQTYELRNGYAVTLADNAPALVPLLVAIVAAAGLGVVGLGRWRAWQAAGGDEATMHAHSRHAPVHRTVEAAKAIHLAGIIVGGLLGAAVLMAPLFSRAQILATTMLVTAAVALVLIAVQASLLMLLATRRRRIAAEPHLRRTDPQPLQFDTPWGGGGAQ